MKTVSLRDYGCKDEELPTLCKFAAFSVSRDLADFSAYSPKFNPIYVKDFETTIAAAAEVIEPESETAEQKAITNRIKSTLDGLLDASNRLTGYLDLAKGKLNMTPTDFGIKHLRKSIASRDSEGAINSLHLINGSIAKYKEILSEQGLKEDLIAKFANAATSIASDKQKQYEMITHRKGIVHNNLSLLNGLYKQLTEILKTGKILYKSTDPVKRQEYTFTDMKKRVRRVAKPDITEKPKTVEPVPTTVK